MKITLKELKSLVRSEIRRTLRENFDSARYIAGRPEPDSERVPQFDGNVWTSKYEDYKNAFSTKFKQEYDARDDFFYYPYNNKTGTGDGLILDVINSMMDNIRKKDPVEKSAAAAAILNHSAVVKLLKYLDEKNIKNSTIQELEALEEIN